MGLADSLKANVDASAGGAFLSKSFRECKVLLDKMAQNSGWMTRDSTITPYSSLSSIGPEQFHSRKYGHSDDANEYPHQED